MFSNYHQKQIHNDTLKVKKLNPFIKFLLVLGFDPVAILLPAIGGILFAFMGPNYDKLAEIADTSILVGVILNICLLLVIIFVSGI